MKRILSLLLITLTAVFVMAESWHKESGQITAPDTTYSSSIQVEPYASYINFRLRITSTPADSPACDTLKFIIQTKFGSASGDPWYDLLTLTGAATDTGDIDIYLPIDSLETGTYKIGQFIRTVAIASDTVTAAVDYSETPWGYGFYVGFH